MKLSTLAAAVAIAMAPVAAMAEATLYGTMEGAVEMYSGDRDGSDVVFGDSEIGLKVTEDLGNGLSAFGHFTFDIDGEDGDGLRGYDAEGTGLETDQMYMGLSHQTYGTARIGRYDTLSANIGDRTIDQFEGRSQDVTFNDVYGNGVSYSTPSWAGFSGAISTVMDGDDDTVVENEENIDLTEFKVQYDGNGAYVGISYLEGSFVAQDIGMPALSDLKDAETLVIAAAYEFGGENNWRVNAAYEDLDSGLKGGDDGTMWAIGGAADFGNNTVLVGYQDYSDHPLTVANAPTDDTSMWGDANVYTIEGQHHFSKRTKVYVNYQNMDNEALDEDYGTFSLGMRHDF